MQIEIDLIEKEHAYIAKELKRRDYQSEEERIEHARITKEISKANTDEMLKVNTFNKPTL